jgi:hypothetical protein
VPARLDLHGQSKVGSLNSDGHLTYLAFSAMAAAAPSWLEALDPVGCVAAVYTTEHHAALKIGLEAHEEVRPAAERDLSGCFGRG